jgi:uncharacterized protein with GYD domain
MTITTTNYVTLLKVSGNKTKQVERTLRELSQKPARNVNVIGTWTSFGQYDAVCLYQAENEADAMNFVTEQLRGIEGVLSTETLTAIPQATYTPGTR